MKNKKRLIKLIIETVISLILILSGVLSWELYFSKYKIFQDQEKEFLKEAKHYYDLNKQYLPKKGETREMTLQNLYNMEYIGDLFIPKTRQLCDSNSWVRVYQNENGEYEYTTYLKCGKYESKVDHEGPQITLNGNSQIVLAINSQYEELGVEKVIDNKDGNIDVSNVTIDSTKVDTSKVGTYNVTYTVRDKSYNKTVVTRTVVVARNLTETVKNNTDDTNYYKGDNVNNYLLYSGILWRIINANEDGSIKLISDEAITNLNPNYENYEGSNVDTWLKEVLYKKFINPDKYISDGTYCIGNINSITDYSTECDTTITSKIGLLTISDYYKTLNNSASSIYTTSYLIANRIGTQYVEAPIRKTQADNTDILTPIRPVINLKNNLYLLSGDGSMSNPYKLDDYSYAKANDLLNTRITGEYFEYSGLTFRIIEVDSNKNVKAIMATPWLIQPNNQKLTYSITNLENISFNLENTNSYGYLLNNDYTDYIDMTSIVDTEYEIPTITSANKYNECQTTKIKAKILLPKSYELFSASGNNSRNRASMLMYIDATNNNSAFYAVNGANGNAYYLSKEAISEYSVRAVLTLKGDLKISSGKGTINSPYLLK